MKAKQVKRLSLITLAVLVVMLCLVGVFALNVANESVLAFSDPTANLVEGLNYGDIDVGDLLSRLTGEHNGVLGTTTIIEIDGGYNGNIESAIYEYVNPVRGDLIARYDGTHYYNKLDQEIDDQVGDIELEALTQYYYEVSWTADGGFTAGSKNQLLYIRKKTVIVDFDGFTFEAAQYKKLSDSTWYDGWFSLEKVGDDDVSVNWYYTNVEKFSLATADVGTYYNVEVELVGEDAGKYILDVEYPVDPNALDPSERLDSVQSIEIIPQVLKVQIKDGNLNFVETNNYEYKAGEFTFSYSFVDAQYNDIFNLSLDSWTYNDVPETNIIFNVGKYESPVFSITSNNDSYDKDNYTVAWNADVADQYFYITKKEVSGVWSVIQKGTWQFGENVTDLSTKIEIRFGMESIDALQNLGGGALDYSEINSALDQGKFTFTINNGENYVDSLSQWAIPNGYPVQATTTATFTNYSVSNPLVGNVEIIKAKVFVEPVIFTYDGNNKTPNPTFHVFAANGPVASIQMGQEIAILNGEPTARYSASEGSDNAHLYTFDVIKNTANSGYFSKDGTPSDGRDLATLFELIDQNGNVDADFTATYDWQIKRATLTISVADLDKEYNGTSLTAPTLANNKIILDNRPDGTYAENDAYFETPSGILTVSYAVKGNATSIEDANLEWASDVPVNAGTYYVRVSMTTYGNYNAAVGFREVTISKKSGMNSSAYPNSSVTYGDEVTYFNRCTYNSGLVEGEENVQPISEKWYYTTKNPNFVKVPYDEESGNWIELSEHPFNRYSDVGEYWILYVGEYKNYVTLKNDKVLTINKKSLTLTVDNKETTYGEAAPEFTVSGDFVGGQTPAVLGGTPVFTCAYNLEDANNRAATIYVISISGYTSDNYEIDQSSVGTLTVNQRAVTYTVVSKNSVYGSALVDCTANLTSGTLATWDEGVNINYTVYEQYDDSDPDKNNWVIVNLSNTSPVGEYDIVAIDNDSNYDITIVNEVKYTITPAELTVVETPTATKLTYNGSAQTPVINKTITSVNDQTIKYKYSKTYDEGGLGYIDLENIVYTNVADCGTLYYYYSAPNHSPHSGSITIIMDTINATWTAPTARSLTYSGYPQALVNAPTDVVGGTVKYSLDNSNWGTDVPTGTNAMEYNVYIKVEPDGNHNANLSTLINLSIAQYTILITPNSNQGKTYGEEDSVLNYTASDAVENEEIVLTGALARAEGNDAGNYVINIGSLALTDIPVNANYKLQLSETVVNYVIAKKNLTFDFVDTFVYTGNNQKPVVDKDVNKEWKVYGLITGDVWETDIDIVWDETNTIVAGDWNNTVGFSFTGTKANNYKHETYKASLHITRRPLTITWALDNAAVITGVSVDYNGQEHVITAVVESGLVGNDSVVLKLTGNTNATNANNNYSVSVTAGPYQAEGSSDYNYMIEESLQNRTLAWKINQVKATITTAPVASENLVYNKGAQALVNVENAVYEGGTLQFSTDGENYSAIVPTGTNANTYTVYYKVVGDNNHTDSASGNFDVVIDKATITPEVSVDGKTFDNAALTYDTLHLSGNVGGAQSTVLYRVKGSDGDFIDWYTTKPVNADTYELKWTINEIENYYGNEATCEFTIERLPVVPRLYTGVDSAHMSWYKVNDEFVNDYERVYDGESTCLAIQANGNFYSVVFKINNSNFAYALNVADSNSFTVLAGNYAQNGGDPNIKNFKVAEDVTFTWTINPLDIKDATVTLAEQTLVYNGEKQTRNVASVSVGNLNVPFTTSDNAQTNAGDYTLTVTGNNNFTGKATKEWSIAPKSIEGATFSLGAELTYNGQEQTMTVSNVQIDSMNVSSYYLSNNNQTNAGEYSLKIIAQNNFTGEVSANWSIAKATLTITADNKKVQYGHGVPAFTYTVTGYVNNENESVLSNTDSISYFCNYWNEEAWDGTPNAGRTFGIEISGGVTADNYNINYANGTLSVVQAPVTIRINNTNVEYLKDPSAGFTILGVKDGYDLNYDVDYEELGYNYGGYQKGSDVGSQFPISFVGFEFGFLLMDDNYYIAGTENGTLTVVAKNINNDVTINLGDTLTYDGTVKTVTITSVVYGDVSLVEGTDYKISGETSATNAGNYALTISGIGKYTGSLTQNWSILPKPITIVNTNSDPVKITYGDYETLSKTNPLDYIGLKDGFTLIGDYKLDEVIEISVAVEDETYPVGKYGLVKEWNDSNYVVTLEFDDNAYLEIIKRPITVKNTNTEKFVVTYYENSDYIMYQLMLALFGTADESEIEYPFEITDGTLPEDVELIDVFEFMFGREIEEQMIPLVVKLDTIATDGYVYVGEWTKMFNVNDNYDVTFNVGPEFALVIEPKPYYFMPAEGQGKVYGEDDDAYAIANISIIDYDLVEDEFVPTTFNYFDQLENESDENYDIRIAEIREFFAGVFSREEGNNAGNYNFVITDGYVFPQQEDFPFAAGNYVAVVADNAPKYVISPKAIIITPDNKESVYGDAFVELTAKTDVELPYDDTLADVCLLAKAEGVNVGGYEITVIPADNANYSISTFTALYTITAKPIVFALKVDDVDVNGNIGTITYDGLNHTFTIYALGVNEVITADMTTIKNAQSMEITIDAGNYHSDTSLAENYVLAEDATFTFTINKRVITVTAEDKQSVYGDAFVELTATADLGKGDTTADVCSLDKVEGVNVGEYEIFVTPSNNSNYDITVVNGTYTITARPITVTAEDKTSVYGSEFAKLTATADLGYEDTIADVCMLSREEGITVGEYVITVTPANNANYIITPVNGKYTITPKAIIVTADNKTSVYGDAFVALTAQADLAYNDTIADVCLLTKEDGVTVGEYEITVTPANNANYVISTINGAYTITARPVSVTANAQTSEYGQELAELTATVVGLAEGDKNSDVFSLSSTVSTKSQAGEYPILVTPTNNANYTITTTNAKYTVTAATPVENKETGVVSYEKEVSEEKASAGVDVTAIFDAAKKDESKKKEVTTKAGTTQITFDAKAIEQIGDNNDVTLKIVVVEEKQELPENVQGAELMFSITLTGSTFEKGTATVTADFNKEIPEGFVGKVYYVADDGKLTDMKAKFVDGKVIFNTNHFSNYVVTITEKTGLSGGAIAGIIIAVVAVIAIAVVIIFLRKKKGNNNVAKSSESVKTEDTNNETVSETVNEEVSENNTDTPSEE